VADNFRIDLEQIISCVYELKICQHHAYLAVLTYTIHFKMYLSSLHDLSCK